MYSIANEELQIGEEQGRHKHCVLNVLEERKMKIFQGKNIFTSAHLHSPQIYIQGVVDYIKQPPPNG